MNSFSDSSYGERFTGPPPLTTSTEAHVKLQRNLPLALDRQHQIMSGSLPEGLQPDRRLIAEVASATVRAALTTDRTALKARQENIKERLFIRMLFHRKRLGREMSPAEDAELKSIPREEIEKALGDGPGVPRLMAEYDAMER